MPKAQGIFFKWLIDDAAVYNTALYLPSINFHAQPLTKSHARMFFEIPLGFSEGLA